MKPILYTTVTEGTVPSNYGIGVLDCISCQVKEERNGSYELTMEYAANGIHASEIQVNRIIKAKPNFTDDPQLFRIYKVGKTINNRFTIDAQHISYDLSGKIITTGSAGSCVAACALLQTQAGNFTITTDKATSASFSVSEPSSVRSWFGGKAGSLLDVYGGEWKYDNYTASLKQARGADRGVTIRYGKNLTDLSQEMNMENLATGIIPFCVDTDGVQTIGARVSTGLVIDVDHDVAMDFSNDVNFESSTPVLTQLNNLATNYVNRNNLVTPKDSIELDFVQLKELQERVDLCDTVHIYFEALGVSATAKCIETVWDVLEERYTSTTFGDARTNIVDTILAQQQGIESKPSSSMVNQAVERATKLITGNLGGYVVIHDSNGDGEPDEILIMDTDDITTATKVWRWNKNGLGYSSTGYDGTYGLAMTADGAIVADFITAGTMSGNRVRTGLIESTNHQLVMDLDNGTITAPAITLNGQDVGDRLDELEQVSVVTAYALSNSGTNIPSSFPLNQPTTPTEQQPYLWSRTIYTYANGQSNTSYGVSVRGAKGANGADGAGLQILGNYETMADLIADHPTGSAGQAYMVGTDLVVWNTRTNSWENVGRIQGPSGADGLWLAIENNDDGTSMNVTYTAKLFKGVSDVTVDFDAVFIWQMVKESGVTEIATGTDTITVARDSADYGATIRCIVIAILADEDLQDYSYITIQDYSGNNIQIIGSNVVRLIGESAIYKPYAIESQFQVLSDEISARVTQTEFNSLSGTVTTQGTLIQQNAQQILLKADTTTVNTALDGKMGTDMSNRASSILIDSGQIRFDSNSLVVNSNQFTLDANGNAVFGGNITAATLNIAGTPVGIGTAIDNAESDAIAIAATDATNKANAAISTATSAAAADATTKANNAKTQAINTASADATTKANNARDAAISSANGYTDGKISTVNQSLTVMNGKIEGKVSQTDFDALGNTVASQGTAITQNAQAITLKANTSTVNTQLAGKMATDMSNRASSISISSGQIAFSSNTLKVDATNLTITANGQVTANLFKAKNEFQLLDSSGTARGYFKYPSSSEAHFAITDSSAHELAEMWGSSLGGNFQLKNSSQKTIARLVPTSSGAGYMTIKKSNGDDNIYLSGEDGGITANGNISTNGNLNVRESITCLGNESVSGTITAGGNISTSQNISASGNITANGTATIQGDVYSYTSFAVKTSTGYNRVSNWLYNDAGMIYVYNANNDRNIMMLGYNGNITCVSVTQTSSRKVKENIEPMTDEDAEKILLLDAVSFDYKDKSRGTDKRGFIAEDVAEILPNLVTPETEETTASLDYIGMIPYLQAIIKKQQADIDYLKSEIEKLKGA